MELKITVFVNFSKGPCTRHVGEEWSQLSSEDWSRNNKEFCRSIHCGRKVFLTYPDSPWDDCLTYLSFTRTIVRSAFLDQEFEPTSNIIESLEIFMIDECFKRL